MEASHHPIDGFFIVEPPKPSHQSIDGFSIAGLLFSIQAVTSLLAGKAHYHSRGHTFRGTFIKCNGLILGVLLRILYLYATCDWMMCNRDSKN